MCTLIAAVRMWPGAPLVVAANRDESLSRPATPPFVRGGSPKILAPRDDQAGGTWLGLNESGLFAGVTNRAGADRDLARRSRGALVMEALGAPSASDLHARLASLGAGEFNAFHLLYADRESAWLTWSDGREIRQKRLEPGLHVITERSLGAASIEREAAVMALWDRHAPKGPVVTAEALIPVLTEHAENPFSATCVHADMFGYGTRSSMILTLGERLEETRMLWAEGKPCVTPFVDERALLSELAGSSADRR